MAKAEATVSVFAPSRKPDGIVTTQAEGQPFVVELFFDHSTKETFQDKLLKVILAERSA